MHDSAENETHVQKESTVQIAAGCSLGCMFCERGEGRFGALPAAASSPGFDPPVYQRVLIGFGDVVRRELSGLVRRLRDKGAQEVLVYAHPGVRDVRPLQELAENGLTGVHLLLPAADRAGLDASTNGRGSIANAARLMEAASRLGLDLDIELPVLPTNHHMLADTVRRALARGTGVRALHVVFHRLPGRDGDRGGWDVRRASRGVSRAVAVAFEHGTRVRLDHRTTPPPCVLDVTPAHPDLYGSFRGPA